jgi:hypothetical protein
MKFTFVILLFLSLGADAQMIIKAHANYIPYAQPSANLLLDDYPNAAAAYSLRKLDKDYTGASIRVRKDTTGQPEQDIFFVGNELDTVALKSFIRNNSGLVVTWYDQSGNGRNITNSTQAAQPIIVGITGNIIRTNGKVCINFQSGDFLLFSSTYTITHTVQVAKVVTQNTINYIYSNASNGLFWNGTFAGVNGIGGFDGTNLRSITGEDLNQHLAWYSMRGGNIHIARDGGSETNAGVFSASLSLDRIGGRQSPALLDFRGEIQEVVSWNSNESANKNGIQTNINNFYGIY